MDRKDCSKRAWSSGGSGGDEDVGAVFSTSHSGRCRRSRVVEGMARSCLVERRFGLGMFLGRTTVKESTVLGGRRQDRGGEGQEEGQNEQAVNKVLLCNRNEMGGVRGECNSNHSEN